MTVESFTSPADRPKPSHPRRRQPFGGHVAVTVANLQKDYQKRRSGAVAAMARLRAAAGSPPGDRYDVLAETQVPEKYLEDQPGDEPTRTEQAKHTALTLFALHQQSSYDQPMHVDGCSLGAAIGRLSEKVPSPEAVRRRFAALGTATTYNEAVYHLRGLIPQLRDQKIGFDYGLLADDLVTMQRSDGRERIRAQWGRDYYRAIRDIDTDTPGVSDRAPHQVDTIVEYEERS